MHFESTSHSYTVLPYTHISFFNVYIAYFILGYTFYNNFANTFIIKLETSYYIL